MGISKHRGLGELYSETTQYLPQRNLACWNHAEVEAGRRCLLERKPSSGLLALSHRETNVCNSFKEICGDD